MLISNYYAATDIFNPQKVNLDQVIQVAPAKTSPEVNRVNFDYIDISHNIKDQSVCQDNQLEEKTNSVNCDLPKNIKQSLIGYLEQQNKVNSDMSVFGKNALPKDNFLGVSKPVTASLSDGTTVNIIPTSDGNINVRISSPNEQSLEVVNIASNVRFTKNDLGQIQMVTQDATTTFDSHGNILTIEEGGNPFLGTDRNDIIINMNSTEVSGGAGNDIIINFAKDTNIDAGDGDDKVILAGGVKQNLNIYLGDGNDSVEMDDASHVNILIDGGDGDDRIKLGNITGAQNILINGKGGNDSITAGKINGDSYANIEIYGEAGDDNISTSQIFAGGNVKISGDDGDDSINVGAFWSRGKGFLSGGNGNDIIKVGTAIDSVIDGGDGDNEISIETMFRSLLINGNDNDSININTMLSSVIMSKDKLEEDLYSEESATDENTVSESDVIVPNIEAQSLESKSFRVLNTILSKNSNIYGFTKQSDFDPVKTILTMDKYL